MRKTNLKRQKDWQIVLLWLLVALCFTACAEKDPTSTSSDGVVKNLPKLSSNPDFTITMPSMDTDFDSAIVTQVDFRGDMVDAIPLTYFLQQEFPTADSVFFKLYYFNQVGYDNAQGEGTWSPRASSNVQIDLSYDAFSAGYLLPNNDFRTYFPDQINGYNTKWVHTIELHRAFIIEDLLGDEHLFEIGDLPIYTILNHATPRVEEPAVKFTDIISYFTDTPEEYVYLFTSSDRTQAWANEYSFSFLQDGYYLRGGTDRTAFPVYYDAPDAPSGQIIRVSYLYKISLKRE